MKIFNLKKNLFIIFLLYNFDLFSQVINVESKRQSDENGLNGVIEFSYDYKKSKNIDWEFTSLSYLQWDNINWSFLLLNEINFDRAGGVDFSNDGYQHLRINRHLNNKHTLESFIQNQYDPVRDIKNRKIYGLGYRYKLINYNFIGVSSFYENEILNDGIKNRTVRLSSYLKLKFNFSEYISLISTTYIQPDLFNLKDCKISNDNELSFLINDNFSFINSFEISYDEFPAEGVPKLIYGIQNGLVYKF